MATSHLTLVLFCALLCNYYSVFAQSESDTCGVIPTSCPCSSYRSYDGSCNNLQNPSWGSANTTYGRLIAANYSDGHSSPRAAQSGNPLPSARLLSTAFYPNLSLLDISYTVSAMQFGQVIAHDMSSLVNIPGGLCCTEDFKMLANPPDSCFPIPVPANDPVYSQYGYTCLPLSRSATDEDFNCLGNRSRVEQITSVSAFLDLNIVYGNSVSENANLRSFVNGRLIMNNVNNQDMLPTHPNPTCSTVGGSNLPCYMSGDPRVNQNPDLTILQTLLAREHNRIADTLAALHPEWEDECIFQEARKINIAQYQYIAYYEWLPIFIGSLNSLTNKITYSTLGFVEDYNPLVNPVIYNEHATGASRYFHTLIQARIQLMNENRLIESSTRLSDNINSPRILESSSNNFDSLTRGMCTQAMEGADVYHTSEITSNWIRTPETGVIGRDLKAIDIQRSRDHGIASYNDYRVLCGLSRAHSFLAFLDSISLPNILRLQQLYETPDDVELAVAASLENPVLGTLAGKSNLCILIRQFYISRVSDRFWFERSGDTGFNLGQLQQIRKASISKIICDNSKSIERMQINGFKTVSFFNPLLSCDYLPSIDLSLWKDATCKKCQDTTSTITTKTTTSVTTPTTTASIASSTTSATTPSTTPSTTSSTSSITTPTTNPSTTSSTTSATTPSTASSSSSSMEETDGPCDAYETVYY
ncbi:peroxidase-like [Anthonomus grandis grandis]|uniref:peroxidase-like n=1 Tax=Anthonomus grandis grandis TaxID=2921223 RepID=UPI0021660BDE|nr:peroxidase-like [Anthonomus grandis grandis]